MISEITGIQDLENFEEASVAQKMSWASKRETTRIEDRAYSLMGLFGINMPPLYGEGQKSFIRLQLEILRISDDETIFAWEDAHDMSGGLLARSPIAFQQSGNICRLDLENERSPPYSMTNKGVRMESYLLLPRPKDEDEYARFSKYDWTGTYLVALQCTRETSEKEATWLTIRVMHLETPQYARVDSGELISMNWN